MWSCILIIVPYQTRWWEVAVDLLISRPSSEWLFFSWSHPILPKFLPLRQPAAQPHHRDSYSISHYCNQHGQTTHFSSCHHSGHGLSTGCLPLPLPQELCQSQPSTVIVLSVSTAADHLPLVPQSPTRPEPRPVTTTTWCPLYSTY